MCRVFKKRIATVRKVGEHESPIWYDDHGSFMTDMDSPKQHSQSTLTYQYPYPCKKETNLHYQIPPEHFLQLPPLESPNLLPAPANTSGNSVSAYGLSMANGAFTHENMHQSQCQVLPSVYSTGLNNEQAMDQVTDWRVLDKFVASQLSQEEGSKESDYSNTTNTFPTSDGQTIGKATNGDRNCLNIVL